MRTNAYQQLEKRFRRIHLLKSIGNLLRWDGEVMMPSGSTGIRAEQLALLETESNSILRAKQTATLLDGAESAQAGLDEWQSANLREMRRLWLHANAIPNRLVHAFHRVTTEAENRWRRAVEENDFAVLTASLRKVVEVLREKGRYLGEALGVGPYDALLDVHDAGRTTAELESIFRKVRADLAPMLEPVMQRQSAQPCVEITVPVPIGRQKAFCKTIMNDIGFPFHKGRLDESLHPFTEGTAEDIRVTTRFDEHDFLSGLMGVLHETGHAMYDYGLPAAWATQPVGRDRGMAIHESQALLLEMIIGRSREFMQYCAPLAAKAFAVAGEQYSALNLYRLATRVRPSLIRMDADEVTYPMHVLLRWELERELFDGSLDVGELPQAWNERMHAYLDVVPGSDREGCLQDSHWPLGYFGYFPTYMVGQVIAAQLFAIVRRDLPGVETAVASGDFTPLFSWLNRNIYAEGARLSTTQLLTKVAGEAANPDYLLAYLRDKYLTD